jgi:hypothetical protein
MAVKNKTVKEERLSLRVRERVASIHQIAEKGNSRKPRCQQ